MCYRLGYSKPIFIIKGVYIMSLKKSIYYGKEHRKDSKHCICFLCVSGRLYKNTKRLQCFNDKLACFKRGVYD